MKKKILFTLLTLALFICLFAVAVGAKSQSYSSYEVTLTDGTTKTVYAAGLDQWEGRVYLNAKLYAEAPLDTDGTYEEVDWTTVEELDFSNVMLYVYDSNKNVWNEREYGSNQGNTALCLYPNGLNKKTQLTSLKKVTTGKIVTLREGVFNRAPALETLVISSNLKYIQNNAFYYCNTLKEIKFDGVSSLETITDSFVGCTSLTEVYLPASLKSLNNTFNGCTSLKNVDLGGVTSIGSSTFKGCTSLESIYIPASVTYIGSDCWRNCSGVTKITFDPNCPVTHIYAHTFDGTKATEITLPNSVEQIGQSNFNSGTYVTINLGASFVGFQASNGSQPPFALGSSLKYIYLSDTFDCVRNAVFSWNDNNANEYNNIYLDLTFFYTGTKEQAESIVASAKDVNTYISSMTVISASDYAKAVADGTLVTGTKGSPARYMVYDYNKCEAFYGGEHTISDEAECKFEGEDYISRYISVCACTRGCGSDAVTEICGPLFKNKGYSVYEENSKGNITYGIYVDEANVEAYEKFTGNTVSFGFVVGNVNDELDGKIIGNDGTCLVNGAIATDFATIDFKSFSVYNLKLTGIATDAQKSKSIYCGTYVVDGGIVSYIGDNVTDKSVAVSYNSIYEAKKDEE